MNDDLWDDAERRGRLYEAERALTDNLITWLLQADSTCSLVAAREPTLTDENRMELRAVALGCRDAAARYQKARELPDNAAPGGGAFTISIDDNREPREQ